MVWGLQTLTFYAKGWAVARPGIYMELELFIWNLFLAFTPTNNVKLHTYFEFMVFPTKSDCPEGATVSHLIDNVNINSNGLHMLSF